MLRSPALPKIWSNAGSKGRHIKAFREYPAQIGQRHVGECQAPLPYPPEPIRVSVALSPKHVGRKEPPMSITNLLQGAAVGAVATLAIGFFWGGWVTGGAAERDGAKKREYRSRDSACSYLRR
jgi:hypothetical protein